MIAENEVWGKTLHAYVACVVSIIVVSQVCVSNQASSVAYSKHYDMMYWG